MDRVMKAMKAVHSVATAGASVTKEDLEKQRTGQDLFSKVATPVIGVTQEDFMIQEIPAQWVRSEFGHNDRYVIFYCHGGGYTCGSLKYAGILAGKLCRHTGLDVLSFEYRLAPENPYPAAIEDALQAWDYLMYQGFGAKHVIVAGDSAGGNLALELCLKLKEQHRKLPKALVLMSPWTDMTVTSETYETCLEIDPLLTPEYVKAVRGAYAGEDVDYSLPQYSPLYGDLSDFPPTLIQVGTNEILLDDSRKLAKKLQKEDCFAKLTIYQDGWHVFQQMPIRRAFKAMDDIAEFIQKTIC